jgi:hypothetical protein
LGAHSNGTSICTAALLAQLYVIGTKGENAEQVGACDTAICVYRTLFLDHTRD